MTQDQFRDHPAIKAHFPEVAKTIDELLIQQLLDTCHNSTCTAEMAPAEAAAGKAIANLIKIFRSVGSRPAQKERPAMPRLNRFTDKSQQPKNDQ